jgi:hypothetical protein
MYLERREVIKRNVFRNGSWGDFHYHKLFLYKDSPSGVPFPWTSLTVEEALKLRDVLNEAYDKGELR